MTTLQTFFQYVSADNTVQDEVSEALSGKGYEETVQTIVELAASHGFSVSAEDVVAAFPRENGERNIDQELSDGQLSGVAGGRLWRLPPPRRRPD